MRRCDWSDLPAHMCGHCLGHAPLPIDPEVRPSEPLPAVRVWPPRERQREDVAGEPLELPTNWAPDADAGECRCGKPTRDNAYVCDDCCDLLSRALGDVPWADEQLEATMTKQRATPTEGTSPSHEKPLPWHEKAADVWHALRATIVAWVRFCDEEGVRNQSPRTGLPEDNLEAMSAWLLWRVDGLALHDIGPEAVDEITNAVADAHRIIDRRPDRWYAGPCDTEDCRGELYAKARVGTVQCRDCKATYSVAERRSWLLDAAEDRLATASTVARAVSWLGAEPLSPSRVWKWAERGRIVAKGHDGHRPLYRIGDALDLLAADTTRAG